MIDFPQKAEGAESFVRERERRYAHPPLPLPLERENGPQPLVTMRWGWTQPLPDLSQHRAGEMVEQIEAHGNPLRQLAAFLLDAAEQADRDGFVPLGLNLETRYFIPWSRYFGGRLTPDREALCVQVAVTVRGVRREWLDRNRTTEEAEVLL